MRGDGEVLWAQLSGMLVREQDGVPRFGVAMAEDVSDRRRLQYRLHTASESALGLSPPVAAEPAHTELAAALTGARDATGDVVEAADVHGARGVDALLHEWRGALFRVRLARLRLTGGGCGVASPFNERAKA